MIGVVIGGTVNKIKIRIEGGKRVGLGDIVYVKEGDKKILYKIVNIYLSSEHSEKDVELIAEEVIKGRAKIFEEEERFYRIVEAKQIGYIVKKKVMPYRGVPKHFSPVYKAGFEELKEIVEEGDVKIGYLRYGSEVFKEVSVALPNFKKIVTHHILISAATGKGKSNFAKVLLKGILEYGEVSAIVLDPHKEYWGKGGIKGLRDLPKEYTDRIYYYTLNPREEGGYDQLLINPNLLEPSDFYGIIDLTETQIQALETIYRLKNDIMEFIKKNPRLVKKEEGYEGWIDVLLKNPFGVAMFLKRRGFTNPLTTFILRRKILYALDIIETESGFESRGCFSFDGKDIFKDIIEKITKESCIVILDTSFITDISERVLASAVASRVFSYYRYLRHNEPSKFEEIPPVMILFEEAPRFIGKSVLAKGTNVFERIAREGRKFKVGLCAITQMPSLIPREILSQMNTKVILGTPSSEDRRALIESSAQNIEDEDREIQILDVGEAIITSPFIKFPYSVKIYNFEEIISEIKSSGEELEEEFEIGIG